MSQLTELTLDFSKLEYISSAGLRVLRNLYVETKYNIIPKNFVSVVIDFFGSHVSFFDKGDGTVSCNIEVSREVMRHWAGQFADVVRVESPPELVEEIREDLRKANANYGL